MQCKVWNKDVLPRDSCRVFSNLNVHKSFKTLLTLPSSSTTSKVGGQLSIQIWYHIDIAWNAQRYGLKQLVNEAASQFDWTTRRPEASPAY